MGSNKLIRGVNDLATVNPELAKEWHPIKNGDLKPTDVAANSSKKVWWFLPFDDPQTGKHFDFEWQAKIQNRNRGNGCPFLSGRTAWPNYNDLVTINPELAKEWHPTKNGDLKPTEVTANANITVWWYLPYVDHKTGKHFNFEWQATIDSRDNGAGCPYLVGKAIWLGFNDLATVNPKLAAEWHPTKNGKLKPNDILANSNKSIWWLYSYDDPKTGKHFNFEWQEKVSNRNMKKYQCPYLTGHSVLPGYNDLATVNPELAKQWHPTKNGNLTPYNIAANSNKKVWWFLPCDDPKTEERFDFEWQSTVNNRSNGNGCPFISASKTTLFIQDLLKNNRVNFVCEKTFPNLKNINSLRFDFQINNNCIIEIDGIQHFKAIDYFGGKKAFKQNIKRDNLKNEYCYNNNIPLLRIPYIYDPVADKEKIEQFVLDFITTGKVPQEIIDFYAKHKFSNYTKCTISNTLLETA